MNCGVRQSELRVDVLTGRRVILVPGRAARQNAVHSDPPLLVQYDPFAEGAEAETPGECFAVRSVGTPANGPGWSLRVVPNRYPIAVDTGEPKRAGNEDLLNGAGLFPAAEFSGRHEVVIECPDSRSRLLELSHDEVVRVFAAWRERCRSLIAADRYRTLAVYRNEGFSAGASLPHCHSQILATSSLSVLDETRLRRATAYRSASCKGLLNDLLAAEQADGSRIVMKTARLLVLCPFAPRSAWHVRFAPWPAVPAFFDTAIDEILSELADVLLRVLAGIESVCGQQISMNLAIAQSPVDRPAEWSWMLELFPRLTKQAGWELLTDEETFPGRPEDWARALRAAL
jgi:UDPglucose--hexose-1-phosphate uridylyltransferase